MKRGGRGGRDGQRERVRGGGRGFEFPRGEREKVRGEYRFGPHMTHKLKFALSFA
jgi:hypothetical protein